MIEEDPKLEKDKQENMLILMPSQRVICNVKPC